MSRWRGNPWAMLTALSLGFFMVMLDLTIVNVAIPSIVVDLHASLDDVGWVINTYVIVLAVLLITAGRLGDMRGPRNLLLLGVVVFTLASVACGFAQSPGQLIAARAVQGLGAALLLPQTMAIIITAFPPARRGAALGVWGAVTGLATIAGPVLGGLLVTAAGWRWVFFINVPIGMITIVLAVLLLPNLRPHRSLPLDLTSVVLSSAGLVLLTFGLVEGQKYHWGTIAGWLSIPLILAAAAACLALFVVDQARKQDRQPLFPFVLFHDRNYTLMNGVNMTVSISMLATFLPLSIYMQSVLGFSALKTGGAMAPLAILSMVVAPVAGRLVDRIGGKYILFTGLLLFGAGIGYVLLVARVDSLWYTFLPGLVIAGLGLGATFGPMQTLATYQVPPPLAGAASGVLNTVRQLGSVVGGLLVVVVLQNRLSANLDARADDVAVSLPPGSRAAFLRGVHAAAAGGADIGAGGVAPAAPTGTTPDVARQLADAGRGLFTHAYVDALRPTLLITVLAMLVGAALCLGVRAPVRGAQVPAGPSRPNGQPGPDGSPRDTERAAA